MNTKQRTAPKQQNAVSAYLDDIYSSWPSLDYIEQQGPILLALNYAMTQDEAKQAVSDWIENLQGVKA